MLLPHSQDMQVGKVVGYCQLPLVFGQAVDAGGANKNGGIENGISVGLI